MVGVAIIAIVNAVIWYGQIWPTATPTRVSATTASSGAPSSTASSASAPAANAAPDVVSWRQEATGWQPMASPPACPSPLKLQPSPVDLKLVTSVLYPGQTRGGNYKAHGGFRFDNLSDNAVVVHAPMAASLVRGARYLVSGETQYTFDFMTPCGIMYRLGHLLTLDPKYAQIAAGFPAAVEGDSRTQLVTPQLAVVAGEVIATEVGTSATGINTFVDFGVYDMRTRNQASQNSNWATQHDPELAQHALCWFDLLPSADATRVHNLPAGDPNSGRSSDFCK